MQTLRIEAASPASAHTMIDALAGFKAELVEGEDGCSEVVVSLGGDTEIVGVLNALEQYVTQRRSALFALLKMLEFEGHEYTMHVEPEPEPMEPAGY